MHVLYGSKTTDFVTIFHPRSFPWFPQRSTEITVFRHLCSELRRLWRQKASAARCFSDGLPCFLRRFLNGLRGPGPGKWALRDVPTSFGLRYFHVFCSSRDVFL